MGKFTAAVIIDISGKWGSGLAANFRRCHLALASSSCGCHRRGLQFGGRFLPHFRVDVYATWFSIRHLRKSSVLPTHPYEAPAVLLLFTVLDSRKCYANQTRNWAITIQVVLVPYPLIFLVWLIPAWVSVGSAIVRDSPTFVLHI